MKVTGYCMGGALSLLAAAHLSSQLSASVPFYGIVPQKDDIVKFNGIPETELSSIIIPVQGHYAEHDTWITKDKIDLMESQLKCPHEIFIYPGAHHAFTNETRPEVYDAKTTQIAMDRTMVFFGRHLLIFFWFLNSAFFLNSCFLV